MLSGYVTELKVLFGVDGRPDAEKERLMGLIMDRLLRETRKFLISTLATADKKEFEKQIKEKLKSGDLEEEMSTMTKYLMKVPDVRYLLDNWMAGAISGIKARAIKDGR